ncbi:hypothetical protein OF83DRAFT_1144423, partial [Amylostereum chailletii]
MAHGLCFFSSYFLLLCLSGRSAPLLPLPTHDKYVPTLARVSISTSTSVARSPVPSRHTRAPLACCTRLYEVRARAGKKPRIYSLCSPPPLTSVSFLGHAPPPKNPPRLARTRIYVRARCAAHGENHR